MLIGLLRHGEVEGGDRFRGRTDDALTAGGLARMEAAVAASGGWQQVVSSPLVRCAGFTRDYARRHAVPHSLDARLMEMHFGAWEGLTAAELMATDPDALARFWNDPLHNTPPGGEPLPRFRARVLDAWRDILLAHARERVLLVTHGGVIRVLLCQIMRASLAQVLNVRVGHGQLYRVHIGLDGSERLADDP